MAHLSTIAPCWCRIVPSPVYSPGLQVHNFPVSQSHLYKLVLISSPALKAAKTET